MNLADLPSGDLERLEMYRRARAEEEEREKVVQALLKAPEERTEREKRILAYSRYGTASGCGY